MAPQGTARLDGDGAKARRTRSASEIIERGGTILYYVKKLWAKNELTGAFTRMRQKVLPSRKGGGSC